MDPSSARRGLLFGIGAYGLWGLIPLYFRQLLQLRPAEILAHRIIWSFLFVIALVAVLSRWTQLRAALRSTRAMVTLATSTALIAINWLTYIDAVATGQVLQASLGYFVTPLMNVLLGVIFLHERLRAYQICAIVLAMVGVAMMTIVGGVFPWIALTLSITFALYGLLRKTVAVDGLLGLTVETMLLLPVAASYLMWLYVNRGTDSVPYNARTQLLLLSSGVITAVPLLMFAGAARRLTLATLGILQYLAPTIQFLLAVLWFGEDFSKAKLASFVFIWIAVVIYSGESLLHYRRQQREQELIPVTAPEM